MSNTIRVALPGYNALTDTNLDHFSLYGDTDNVLIKRKIINTATIADGSPTILTVAHNLGYIPYFIVYCDRNNDGNWAIVNNQYNLFTVPDVIASADTTNLYIYNYGGHGSGNVHVVYEIYYDNMNDTTSPSIVESSEVIKVARPGKSVASKNPNDYIMHSDLNNLKILKEGIETIDVASRTGYTFSHGVSITTPCKYIVYVKKRNDGKTVLLGGFSATKNFNATMSLFGSNMDTSEIFIDFPTQSAVSDTIDIKWFIFGSGISNSITKNKPLLAVAKQGNNVFTETSPDNFNFHSNYSTLKYYLSGNYSMTVTDTTVQTIPHNLGYVPFFIGFVGDLAGTVSNGYALMPYYFGRSSISSPLRDVAAWIYADETNIYLKAWYQTNAIGTSFTFNFYYKIFKNNLGL